MWWFVGLIFFGWLTWVLWTYQTHIVADIFTIPGSIFHLYHHWRQRGGKRLPVMYATDTLAYDLCDAGIILVTVILMTLCSWKFFSGTHHALWEGLGVLYIILIIASTLFLDIKTRT